MYSSLAYGKGVNEYDLYLQTKVTDKKEIKPPLIQGQSLHPIKVKKDLFLVHHVTHENSVFKIKPKHEKM